MSDPRSKKCLRPLDNVGPVLGAPHDTVLKLDVPSRDHSRRAREIRTIGRDLTPAGALHLSTLELGGNDEMLIRWRDILFAGPAVITVFVAMLRVFRRTYGDEDSVGRLTPLIPPP